MLVFVYFYACEVDCIKKARNVSSRVSCYLATYLLPFYLHKEWRRSLYTLYRFIILIKYVVRAFDRVASSHSYTTTDTLNVCCIYLLSLLFLLYSIWGRKVCQPKRIVIKNSFFSFSLLCFSYSYVKLDTFQSMF